MLMKKNKVADGKEGNEEGPKKCEYDGTLAQARSCSSQIAKLTPIY